MAKEVYSRGDAIVCGITVKSLLGVQTNPANGVEITITDPDGTVKVNSVACTPGQYDEENNNATGQYYYVFQSTSAHTVGKWSAEFLIDPGGTYEGLEVDDKMFYLKA